MKQPIERRRVAVIAVYLDRPVMSDAALGVDRWIVANGGEIFFNPTFIEPAYYMRLAEFPDAVSAIICAAEIHTRTQNAIWGEQNRITLQIGLAFGPYADVVDVAAALARFAGPGSIRVSQELREQVRGKLDPPVHRVWVTKDGSVILWPPPPKAPGSGLFVPLLAAHSPSWFDSAEPVKLALPPPAISIDMAPGSILWNPPRRMRVGRSERIDVRIADIGVTQEALREGLRGRGLPLIDKLDLVPLMRVSLIADPEYFSVQALSTQDQLVVGGVVARWDYHITPLHRGLHQLRLLASMRIKIEGKEELFDLPAYEAEVKVAVAPVRAVGRFCARNWKWIAQSIIIPAAVWAASKTNFGSAALTHIRQRVGALWSWIGSGP